ncbi:MAG TPA: RodZ domain-containing protein [Gaiellaceae bacterium]|nr:RodZ domain-containing protein [Gaiellaceae bacterium]
MFRKASNIAFALLTAGALGLAVFAVLAFSGHFADKAPAPLPTRAAPPPPPPPAPPPPAVVSRATGKTKSPRLRIRISASRGDCWIEAHEGSSAGPLLLQRLLRQGETVTISGRKVWLSLGAAGNVDVLVNGIERTIPTGTTSVRLD